MTVPVPPNPEGARMRLRTPPPWKDDNPVCTLITRSQVKYDDGSLREFLAGGERLLALVDFTVAPGKRAFEEPPDDRSRGQKAFDRTGNAVVFLLGGANSPSLNRMLGVKSVSAHAGSWVYRLLQAWREDRSGIGDLLVTDQRFTLVSARVRGKGDPFQTLLDIPREAVADVRLAPTPMVRGRVVLSFTDGSVIALKYGTWRSGVARRMVDAVNQWRMSAVG